MREAIEALHDELFAEIEHERQGLIAISGPSGMRNSISSALGLARNSIRQEVVARLVTILTEEGD